MSTDTQIIAALIGGLGALKLLIDLWSKARDSSHPEASLQIALAQLEGRITGRVDLLAQSAAQTARSVERLEEASKADVVARAQVSARVEGLEREQEAAIARIESRLEGLSRSVDRLLLSGASRGPLPDSDRPATGSHGTIGVGEAPPGWKTSGNSQLRLPSSGLTAL